MKVGLPFQKTEKCNEAFKPLSGGIKLRNGIDDASMICAGELDGNKDTCQVRIQQFCEHLHNMSTFLSKIADIYN